MNASRFWRALAPLTLVLACHSAGAADSSQTYPTKPVRVVVTFPPGGASDSMVRLITPSLNDRLKQQAIVDNRPGAGGNVGLGIVVKASPDGYTVGVAGAGGLAANVSFYQNMTFDPNRDLRAVGLLAYTPFVIVGSPSFPAHTLKEVLALAAAKPNTVSVGHGGNGTAMHLSAALLAQMAHVKLNEVPYRGSGPVTIDVLGGQVSLAVLDLPASLEQIKAGKLVPFAVTSAHRLAVLPDVPTVAEAGVAGYESIGWLGVVVPAGTPDSVVTRLNSDLNASLSDPAVSAAMLKLGAEPAPTTPSTAQTFMASETKKWAGVIKTADIKPE